MREIKGELKARAISIGGSCGLILFLKYAFEETMVNNMI